MATSRQQKIENAEVLRETLAGMPNAFLVNYEGLDVASATDLRRQIREQEGSFRVVKNSTALRAVEELPLAELNDAFVGQTAIAYTAGDAVAIAKVLREFHKEFETPSFKAGIVDGAPISAEEFDQLAQLPGREQLIGKALFLMNYPVSGLVTALSGILRQAVTVLEQIREQKEAAGDVAPAGEAAVEEAPAEEAAAEETPAEEAAAEEAPAEEAAAEETPAEEAPAEAAAEEAAAEEAPAEEAEAAADEAAEEEAEEAAAPEEAEEAAADAEEPEKAAAADAEGSSDDEAGDEKAGDEEE